MKGTIATILIVLTLLSCGGNKDTTSESIPTEQESTLDSVSVAVDQLKADISAETKNTIEEIDSLLNDI